MILKKKQFLKDGVRTVKYLPVVSLYFMAGETCIDLGSIILPE